MITSDQSRDRRIEDLTNLWIIHPVARLLLPWFIARRISANAVSVGGLAIGGLAALAYARWHDWSFLVLGLLLSVGWLIADGLDGLIARATNTTSALGRALDGVCDHGVFVLIYVALALSIGTLEGWLLAFTAGAAHAVQSNIYESERTRFHRRCAGAVHITLVPSSRNPIVRFYDAFAEGVGRNARSFDAVLRLQTHPEELIECYGSLAARPMRLLRLLSANIRVFTIFIACLIGDPRLFWWLEVGPLTIVLVTGFVWHRRVEVKIIRKVGPAPSSSGSMPAGTV